MPLRQIAAVLAYRILPFLACALFSRAMSVVQRVAVVLSFACALFVARRFSTDLRDVLVRGPLALIYFAAVSLAVYEIERRNRRLPAPLLLAGCAIAYMLAPALLLPSPFIGATIGIGWEVMLSAFSFYIDSRAAPTLPTRRDCLFFIIVNPCLVFADSGRPIAEPVPWRGVGRVAFGLGTWVLQCFIAAVALKIPAPRSGSYAAFVMVGVTAATHLYLAHSGLASVQIGLTRIVGHQVPERYNYPFLFRSPEDFWRRWNAYLGTWVKRYVSFDRARCATCGTASPQMGRIHRGRARCVLLRRPLHAIASGHARRDAAELSPHGSHDARLRRVWFGPVGMARPDERTE